MNEREWDKKLKIDTMGRDDYHADDHHYPYEPTPYSVLELLKESGYIEPENVVIDYGCGKGRVSFFLSYEIGCKSVGVEYDEAILKQALENQKHFSGKRKPEFYHGNAKNFEIEDGDTFFFFNPFSVEILKSVVGKIVDSYYENPRSMILLFYYPEDEYVSYLMTKNELMFSDEISCSELFEGNNERERILIFEVG